MRKAGRSLKAAAWRRLPHLSFSGAHAQGRNPLARILPARNIPKGRRFRGGCRICHTAAP
jgi:hypothetical protein